MWVFNAELIGPQFAEWGNMNLPEPQIIALLAPLVVIQVGLQAFRLVDLVRRERVKGGNKRVWGAAIVLG